MSQIPGLSQEAVQPGCSVTCSTAQCPHHMPLHSALMSVACIQIVELRSWHWCLLLWRLTCWMQLSVLPVGGMS